MTVDTDNSAKAGDPYLVRVGLTNVSDIPVYNPGSALDNGRLNYIYNPDNSWHTPPPSSIPGRRSGPTTTG